MENAKWRAYSHTCENTQKGPRMTAIIFDLDGTLIDSVPDIHKAASEMLTQAGQAPLSVAKIRSFIGNGVPALITKIMCEIDENPQDSARHSILEQCFMRHYTAAPAVLSTPFDNVRAALEALSADGFKLAVCTNKPEGIARQILQDLNLAPYFAVVVGGDSLPVRKPDPAPLYAAIERVGTSAAIYVGDSEVDSETALNADVPFILFSKGYRRGLVSEIQHHATFSDFAELPDLVRTICGHVSGNWIDSTALHRF
ncbi:phosphoglycolate phosphatase [Roseinatronobacter alkalisoli]|uniref:Phosphoglycolate phosphatase n=1 Tax=Roseinatronobacter alkalisoli TaxID=3028235 RepID=A0ABT5TA41_9RHOB|nr:phosphoglycolate phosphatase [Roseinatronobacter sp. HJB301]MDD7971934.1 phosphoglycolate phosphatase [Roseinatronobacter sp. HJB301]